MWDLIINAYLTNEENKEREEFSCFICNKVKKKSNYNEVEIGNINKIFYICSADCKKQFLNKEILSKLIEFENLNQLEKTKLINKYRNNILKEEILKELEEE